MSDWLENENGNYVFVEDGEVTTVFRDRLGDWRGLRSGERTRGSFDSPEELMEGIELERIEFIPIVANSGWKRAKKGRLFFLYSTRRRPFQSGSLQRLNTEEINGKSKAFSSKDTDTRPVLSSP